MSATQSVSSVGVCKSCGVRGRIRARSLCTRCYRRTPVQHPGRKWRHDEPEQVAAAKARESDFLKYVYPRVVRYGNRCFREAWDRESLVADAVAVAWQMFVRAIADGREPLCEIDWLVRGARREVAYHKSVVGRECSTCPLNWTARNAGGFEVEPLSDYIDGLTDRRGARPGDVAASRVDWRAFLETLDDRARRVAELLGEGREVREVAAAVGLSANRVWDLRSRLALLYAVYQGCP